MDASTYIKSLAELNYYDAKAYGDEGFIQSPSGNSLNKYPVTGNEQTGESNININGVGFNYAGLFTDLIASGSIIQDASKKDEQTYSGSLGLSIPIGKSGFSAEVQGSAYTGRYSDGEHSAKWSGASSSYGVSYENYNSKGSGFNADVSMSSRGVNVGVKGQYRY